MLKTLLISVVTFGLGIAVAIPVYQSFANHEAGKTYTGAHDDGGAVTARVSSNGTELTFFQATDVPLDPFDCPGQTVDVNLSKIPINEFVHHYIRDQVVSGVTVEVLGDFEIPGFTIGFISVEIGDCSSISSFAAGVDHAAPAGVFGDVDCDGDVDAVDSFKQLQYVAGLSVTQTEPCPDIGS